MNHLRRTALPIKQIALAVGFRNEKSFSRAFKGWSGQTPGEFRALEKSGQALRAP
jgi:AraC-like DNA-binding protein